MVRISITAAAFDAISATLPLGSVGYEREPAESGMRLIWLERTVVDRLRAMRLRGEDLATCHRQRSCGKWCCRTR